MSNMNKLSSENLQVVLGEVPGTLRKLAEERDYWKKEAQSRMRHDEAEKVAHAMHEKGISTEIPIDSLIEQLEKAAEKGRLEKIAEAVEMVGPDMGEKIGRVATDDSVGNSANSSSEFERFIMGGVG